MKRLLTSLVLALAIIGLAPILTGNGYVSAATEDAICAGVQATGANCSPNGEEAEKRVNDIVALIINVLSWLVGVISVIMVIFGGFKYITSGGDSNKVTSAKNTILYALIGLVVVVLAQVIVIFVINQVS
jgi:hypothetical protein